MTVARFAHPKFRLRAVALLAAIAAARLASSASAAPLVDIEMIPSVSKGVTNLGDVEAVVEFVDDAGTVRIARTIQACRSAIVSLGDNRAFPDSAGARSGAGAPLGQLTGQAWESNGMVMATGGRPSTRLLVPVAAIGYYGQDTSVTLRNASSETVSITALLRADGATTPVAQLTRVVPPWKVGTLDLAKEPAFLGVTPNTPGGFLGSLELVSDAPFAAWSTVVLRDQPMGVWAVEALRPEDAAGTLYAPLVRHRWHGYDTGIAVANPGDTPVTVDVVYRAAPALIGPQPDRRHGARVLPPRGSTVFYQGPGGGHGLPAPFVGSATIEAQGGAVVAIVNDAFELGAQSAAYAAQPESAASTRLAVPAVTNHVIHEYLITYGIQVMNLAEGTTRVRLALSDVNGVPLYCRTGCEVDVPPGGGHAFVFGFGAIDSGLARNMGGSAELTADRPIIAVVNGFSANGRTDATAYNALPCGIGGSDTVALP